VVAAGSSSSMSSSSNPNCNSTFSGGNIKPGDKVTGTLSLNNGCRFISPPKVHITLNDGSEDKDPDQNGDVAVSVVTHPDGKKADLGDPVTVSVHEGRNDVIVSGQALDQSGSPAGTATIDAFFNLAAATPSTTATTAVVTPISLTPTSNGGGGGSLAHTGMNLFALFLLALVAIALGTYTVASERSVPIAVGDGVGAMAPAVSIPLFDPRLGIPETWTFELVVLTVMSYILGPPPGRHAKKGGPRGLVPVVRDWMYRDR